MDNIKKTLSPTHIVPEEISSDSNNYSDSVTIQGDDIACNLDEAEWSEGEWEETDFHEFDDSCVQYLDTYAESSLGTIAVCGRPNVGKSSLVNRILGRREAVVEDIPGVTRDKINYQAVWNGKHFVLQDTGGWELKPEGLYFSVAKQSEIAIREANIIIFVVDTTVGIIADDEYLAKVIRKSQIPTLLIANKADNDQLAMQASEFWALGLGEPHPLSATHGTGVADVLDIAVGMLADLDCSEGKSVHRYRVALVGKPNVGKSSLLNKLSKEERSVVSAQAGTTVDPVDSLIQFDQHIWKVVDTAGLKKKYHLSRGHEYYATLRTESAIDAAQVVLVLIDASQPLSEQDLRIINLVIEAGRALVILFNKWDCVDEDRRYILDDEIEMQLERVQWAKRLNISATTGRGLQKIEPAMITALGSWEKRISTGHINHWLQKVVAATPPPVRGGKLPRILFATQAAVAPPTFVFFTTGFLEAGYRRFLERKLRESFGFEGSPIKIIMKIKEKKSSRN